MARPYKGLARFDPADADFYFGREEILGELSRRIKRDPVTLIVGPSGGGKSSLVFGGLLPKLERGMWRVASFRPGREPVKNLAWAVAEHMASRADPLTLMNRADELRCKLNEEPDSLIDAARAMHGTFNSHLLLVADQFEELFTICSSEAERAAFTRIIAQIDRQTPRLVSLVGTLRADFMAEVLRIPALGELFDGHYLMLRAMNGDELGRAIREPARTLGVGFENGVDDLILAAVSKDSTALPLMEFALERLWAEQENHRLTRAAYNRMGGLEGALTRHGDEVVDEMSEAEQVAARRLLCRLVAVAQPGDGEDTKRPQSRQELGEELWSVAQRLAGQIGSDSTECAARLIVLYRGEQQREVADLIHEALIRKWPRLRGWLKDERSYLLLVDELVRAKKRWEDGEHPERLLRGPDLEQALENREQLSSDHPELLNLLEKSDERAQEERAIIKADAIWEPLEFQLGEISVRELGELLELAKAGDRVRRAFLRRLCEKQDRAKRFCRLPRLATRAAVGLRRRKEDFVDDIVRYALDIDGSPEIISGILFLLAFSGVDHPSADEALESAGPISNELIPAFAAWTSTFAAHWDATRAARALDGVLHAIGLADEEEDTAEIEMLGQAARTLACRLDADRAGRLLDSALDAIGQRSGANQVRALGQAANALAWRLDAGRASHALHRVVDAIGQSKDASEINALRQTAQALTRVGELSDANHAALVLHSVLDAITQTATAADGDARRILARLDVLGQAARALMETGARPDDVRADHALDRVLAAIGQTDEWDNIGTLPQIAQAFAQTGARPDADSAGRAFDHVVDAISGPMRWFGTRTLRKAAEALSSLLDTDGAVRALSRVMDAISRTEVNPNTFPDKILTLWRVAEALAQAGADLDSDRSDRVLERVIYALENSYTLEVEGLGQAAISLASRLDSDRAARVFDRVLIAMRQAVRTNIKALGQAAQALASRMDVCSASPALHRVVDAIGQSNNADEINALRQTAQALREVGALPDADHATLLLGRVLDTITPITGADIFRWAVAHNGQAIRALVEAGARSDANQLTRALERVLDAISRTADPDTFHVFALNKLAETAQVLKEAGAQSNVSLADITLGRVLDFTLAVISEATDVDEIRILGQIFEALVQTGAQFDPERTLDRVIDAVSQTTVPDVLEAVVQAIVNPLVAAVRSREKAVATIVNALKLPTFAYKPVEEALIAPLRTLHPDMPSVEEGFWVAIDWLRDRYPKINFDGPPR
jgi:energy-coupling factor transporter ATP-binding protein EcfA2